MNILFSFCGRADSKGVANKNLKAFLGIPLAYYSLAAAMLYIAGLEDRPLCHAVLNTDSEELIRIVGRQKKLAVDVIRRDGSLGGDTVPKVSVIRDCLDKCSERNGVAYDMVVDLDITSPLRTVQDIRNAIELKGRCPDTDVVYSVTESRRNPYFNMVKEENGFFVKAIPSDYTARQQAPVFYDMNASIYAYSPRALREKDPSGFFNDRAAAVMMKDTGVLDIDSERDFELLQAIAEYVFRSDAAYREVYEAAREMAEG